LDRRVVRDDHTLAPGDDADARGDAGTRGLVVVEAPGRERVQLEEGRVRVDQAVDPLARGELPARAVSLDGFLAAAAGDLLRALPELAAEAGHPLAPLGELVRTALDVRGQDGHGRRLSAPQAYSCVGSPVLFNSFPFLFVFLPAVAAAYFLVPQHRLRLLLVIGASYYFYAYADWWFPALMAGSTAISYTTGRLIEIETDERRRKLGLATGIAGVLALLAYFKYTAFVGGYALDFVHVLTRESFQDARSFFHGIVLPIGISFYTFEGISYMVDVYRGTL